MSEQVPTLPTRKPRPAIDAPSHLPANASEKKPHEYLLEKGWFPLGDPTWQQCLWLPPGFRLIESYEWISEPMTGEVERYEAGKQLLAENKIGSNPKPAERKQLRVRPASTAVSTPAAYQQQMRLDLQERERQLREEMKAAG